MNDYPCRDQNVKVAQEGSLVESGQSFELCIAHGLASVEQAHDGFPTGVRVCAQRRQKVADPVVRQGLRCEEPSERALNAHGHGKRTIGAGAVEHIRAGPHDTD